MGHRNPMEHRRARRGAEAIEFAFTLPILLILVSGIIDFGWFASNQASIQSAAAVGARAASRATPDTAQAVAEAQANKSLAQARIDATVSTRLFDLSNGDQAIEVQVTAPYTALLGMVDLGATYDAVGVYRLDIQP